LGKYDLNHGLACLDVQAVRLNHEMEVEFLPGSKVVATGRGISCKLMAPSGVLTHDSSRTEDSEELRLSTCKICEVHLHYGTIAFSVFLFLYAVYEVHSNYDMII
jgi:hypothetical protein